jgi:uncharacterized protein (TIGR03000 family)
MYSIVLMAALTTGTSIPDFGFGRWGLGSCTCPGYEGYVYGNWNGPGIGYGYGGWNGCGGCNGWGGWNGCGGWNGGPDYGPPYVPLWGCCDYFGGHGGYGTGGGFYPGTTAPAAPGPEQVPPPKIEEKNKQESSLGRARLTVQLPADARLYVDDQPIRTSKERQSFSTPRLEQGQRYYYEVRGEVVRDGKTVKETKRVVLRAGENVTVSFSTLEKPTMATAELAPRR